MFTYINLYVWYTLPFIGVLTWINRPFINKFEVLKLATISTLAVIYTIPWSNYLAYHGVWSHSPERVLAVPVEKYVFLALQNILTGLWTLLCVRWSLPCLSFNHDKQSYQFVRWIPILLMAVATVAGHVMAIPGKNTFYLGCILLWISPVFIILWYGAGNFFAKKMVSSSVSILVPTLYQCYVDKLLLKDAVLLTTNFTNLNAFISKDLLLEDAIFFFVTNALIVLAVNGFDKSRGMIDTYLPEFPVRFGFNWKFNCQLFRAFATPEYCMPSIVTEDIRKIDKIITASSKSFWLTNHFFHPGARLDLMIMYAFCRVTDNMIDDENDNTKNKHKYNVIKKFIDELFADRRSDSDVQTKPQNVQINWAQYRSDLTDMEMAIYRAISRISFYIPRKPFDEILMGFQWDIDNKPIKTEGDLISYAYDVSGSIALMTMYALMYKSENKIYDVLDIDSRLIKKVHQIGVGLQLVNIGRDIIVDSATLGRCYVPTDYLEDEKNELRILCTDKNPRSLGDEKLKRYSTIMFKLADDHLTGSVDVLRCLSYETRITVLAHFDVYYGIATAIQSSSNYPDRALLPVRDIVLLGLYTLYIKSVLY